MDEFVRLQTLLRIEQETERTERIKAEREFIVEQACLRAFLCVYLHDSTYPPGSRVFGGEHTWEFESRAMPR